MFMPVYLGANPPCLALITDVGATGDVFPASVPLRVSDRSFVPETLPTPTLVNVEGHFDDPESLNCRRPAEFPDSSDDAAIQSCRASLIVTRLAPAD